MTYIDQNDDGRTWSGYTCPECGEPVIAKVNGVCCCPECRWTGRLAECEAES